MIVPERKKPGAFCTNLNVMHILYFQTINGSNGNNEKSGGKTGRIMRFTIAVIYAIMSAS